MIAIIDYDAGNIRSVEKALQFLGAEVVITRDEKTILSADHVILPGVGSYGDAMRKIRDYHLDIVLRNIVDQQIPLLGICLGLQLLFERSEEAPGVLGLGILPGEIRRIPSGHGLKVPHIGWNSIRFPHHSVLFEGIEEDAYVYFVHSYYLQAADPRIVTATTEYGTCIHAAVQAGQVYACQFHPEKSSDTGLAILKNFIGTCKGVQ
ncbi:MAG: imidazole glycerol phosphate synthase subunit HisH [Lachnospiraceae bacterium]